MKNPAVGPLGNQRCNMARCLYNLMRCSLGKRAGSSSVSAIIWHGLLPPHPSQKLTGSWWWRLMAFIIVHFCGIPMTVWMRPAVVRYYVMKNAESVAAQGSRVIVLSQFIIIITSTHTEWLPVILWIPNPDLSSAEYSLSNVLWSLQVNDIERFSSKGYSLYGLISKSCTCD